MPAATQDTVAQLTQREQALMGQLSDQVAKLNEANYRIDKLERQIGALATDISRKDSQIQAEQAREATQLNALSKRERWGAVLAGLGGALAASILALVLNRLARRASASAAVDLLPTPASDNRGSMLWQDLHAAEPRREPAGDHTERHHAPAAAADMDVLFLNNVASEAAVLAAHGQYEHAVELLAAEIELHPTQVVNWMQLLELFHGHRDVARFIERAAAFRDRFASAALWEKVARMGHELSPSHPLFSQAPIEPAIKPLSPARAPVDAADELKRVLDGHPEAPHPLDARTEPVEVHLDLDLSTGVMRAFTSPTVEPTREVAVDHVMLDLPPEPVPELASAPSLPEPELAFDLDFGNSTLEGEDELPSSHAKWEPAELDLTGVVEGSLEHAQRLIEHGRQNEGAAMLENIMLMGNLDERLAAAELLVRLTSPE